MILRAFFSSPYASHPAYSIDPRSGIYDAGRQLFKLASPKFQVLMSVYDVRRSPVHCIWSPLLSGDVLRGEIEHYERKGAWPEDAALSWCLFSLRHHGFNTLVRSATARASDYGKNGQDAEVALADQLGLRVMTMPELENFLAH